MIFELTNSFKYGYNHKNKKTQVQNVPESCLVVETEKLSNLISKELEKFNSLSI
jgi:hypothetical protein